MKNFKTIFSMLVLLAFSVISQAEIVYIHNDALGSPIMETNEQGAVISRSHYKPFGDTLEGMKDEVGYTGHLNDADLGLTYMQARYYDPVIGRFYSNDPIGFRDIHSFNRYAYANNNPYKYVDPDGMSSKPTQKINEELKRKREILAAKKNREVPIKSVSVLGANKMLTVSKTHDGTNSKTTNSVKNDELKIAQAFCQCESVEQTVQTFDADSAAQFNENAGLQNNVYQTAAATIPLSYAIKTKNVILGSLTGLVGGVSVGKVQSAPTVSNGDIVITTRSSVNGGGRGNAYFNVVRIHQKVK